MVDASETESLKEKYKALVEEVNRCGGESESGSERCKEKYKAWVAEFCRLALEDLPVSESLKKKYKPLVKKVCRCIVMEDLRKMDSEKKHSEEDDCVILDGDPNKPRRVLNEVNASSDDLVVVAEKGQIACRDYPHARHLCVTFPFKTNPHEKYCHLCHCYVCDTQAPCAYWGTGKSSNDHCHSTDKDQKWRELRQCSKQGKLAELTGSRLCVRTTLSNEQLLNCSEPLNVNGRGASVVVQRNRYTGTIKWFCIKNYGFIIPDDGGEDLFFHESSMMPGNYIICEGERMEFEIEIDEHGRRKASNVCNHARDNHLMSSELDGSEVQGDRYTGTVKWFDGFKGYGFITRDDGGEDVFVHESSTMSSVGFICFGKGERLEFDIAIDDRGRRKAINVCNDSSMRDGRSPSLGNSVVGSHGGSFSQETTGRDKYSNGNSHRVRDERGGGRRKSMRGRRGEIGCYCCGGDGHFWRECPQL